MKQFTVTAQYAELTIEQARDVAARYPASTDPWNYEYIILAGRVIDRYLTLRTRI